MKNEGTTDCIFPPIDNNKDMTNEATKLYQKPCNK